MPTALPLGPLFFIAGLFLIILGPLIGMVAARDGNVWGAIAWWMIGVPLGVGLLMVKI